MKFAAANRATISWLSASVRLRSITDSTVVPNCVKCSTPMRAQRSALPGPSGTAAVGNTTTCGVSPIRSSNILSTDAIGGRYSPAPMRAMVPFADVLITSLLSRSLMRKLVYLYNFMLQGGCCANGRPATQPHETHKGSRYISPCPAPPIPERACWSWEAVLDHRGDIGVGGSVKCSDTPCGC